MIPSPNRREVLAEKLAPTRDMIDGIERLDPETVLRSVGEDLRGQFSGPRFLQHLSLWRARKMVGAELFACPSDAREVGIVRGGGGFVEELTLAVGAHVLWQDIIRLVQRVDADALDNALEIATRPIALRGREQNVGVEPETMTSDGIDLAEQVRREGALSWACWLAARETGSARRLRMLTPNVVADRVGGRLPAEPEQRAKRRFIVDTEIDLMFAADALEARLKEDA